MLRGCLTGLALALPAGAQTVERLTYVVDAIIDARDQARARAERAPKGDALGKRLEAFAAAMEGQRTDLVSTSRGEGI